MWFQFATCKWFYLDLFNQLEFKIKIRIKSCSTDYQSQRCELNESSACFCSGLRITVDNPSSLSFPHNKIEISDCKMYFIWADILSLNYFVAINYKPF